MKLATWLFLGCSLCCLPSIAAGQADPTRDVEARRLFEAATAAYDDGRYEDALRYFQLSFEASDRAGLLYNIGLSAQHLRQDQLAVDSYREYLRRLPEADNRRAVEVRIGILEEALADPSHEEEAADVSPTFGAARDDDSGGVLSQWWFWTIVGAVVAGGTVTAIVLATSDDGVDQDRYAPADEGAVVFTLGSSL